MAQYGVRTSLYMQRNILAKIDRVVSEHKDLFKSRSHFVNCAILREITRLKELKK